MIVRIVFGLILVAMFFLIGSVNQKNSLAEEEAVAAKKAPKAPNVASAEQLIPEKVTLGTDALFTGIPGDGALTLAQIKTWLENSRNHIAIKPALPFGMAGDMKIPKDNPLTRAKIELGRQLFFDKRLSKDGTVSCATCHDPNHGYAADTEFGVGIQNQKGNRNSPTAFNRIFSSKQFWDGRASSLESQAIGPIANPIEMGNTHKACVATVIGIEGYKIQFDAIFPLDGVTIKNIGKAIASFERALITGPAPFDYYKDLLMLEEAYSHLSFSKGTFAGDIEFLRKSKPKLFKEWQERQNRSLEHPISESAKRGYKLFFLAKNQCSECHAWENFTDERYYNLGVGMNSDKPDLGRFLASKRAADQGAFKTPTLRNIAQTAPYMHDGSQKTLEEVIEWYAKGGHPNKYLSNKINKLDLTEQDKKDLVEFMIALTGKLPKVETGRLPIAD